MAEESEEPAFPKTQLAVAFIAIAFAHEYGYWRHFGIRILEHIGLSDLPRLALWPIISLSAGLAFGQVIHRVAGTSKLYPPGGGATTKVGVFLNKLRRPIALGFLGLAYWAFRENPEFWWAVGPFFVYMGLFIGLDGPGDHVRAAGVTVRRESALAGVFLIALAFGVGEHDAISVITGHSFVAASFKGSEGRDLRYLGRAGDYVFLWSPITGETEVSKLESIEPLLLVQETNKATPSRSPGRN